MADHASLTGASLHESKGAATATVGTVYKSDGAGSGSWTTIDYRTVPTGWLVGSSRTLSSAVATGTTTMPSDDTIPQNTEGTQFLTHSHTPVSATNKLVIRATMNLSLSASSYLTSALFKDSDASAIAAFAGYQYSDTTIYPAPHVIVYEMTAGGTSAITFKVRAGSTTALTVTMNGYGSARKMGGVEYSSIEVLEYKA